MNAFLELGFTDRQIACEAVQTDMGLDDAAPDMASSNKQRKTRLEALMAASRQWVQGALQLELGARSDDWPYEVRPIRPYLAERFPQSMPEGPFPVRVLAAERTFWEKACLLHEETFRPADKPRKLRMARHYYDLWCLLRAGVGERALANTALFQSVAEHRELFFRYSWVDYSTHNPGSFRLSPPADHLPDWRADYQDMLGPMFFGETPSFEDLITAAAEFERVFNARA